MAGPARTPQKLFNPAKLFRRWKRAAGPVFGRYVPAAPFSALANFKLPTDGPLLYDRACRNFAATLSQSLEGEAVQSGEAAFVVDLPGPVALGVGFYLGQFAAAEGVTDRPIRPVVLFSGLWRPGAVLGGQESAAALVQYGCQLSEPDSEAQKWGSAFLLERERDQEIAPMKLVATFDNRYGAGLTMLLPPTLLRQAGLKALIDLRLAGDPLPPDLQFYYEDLAGAGLDIFQTTVKL